MSEITSNFEASPSVSSPLNLSSRIVCRVCQKQFSQYTCPRCNIRYCSLHCYKSHSLRCTESFMRENVLEELQQLKPSGETSKKMEDILRRFHSEEEMDTIDKSVDITDEDDSTLSEEVIQKVLSGGQISFDDLSNDEKRRFQRAVASGELSRSIEPWEPWWLKPSARTISLGQQGNQLVQTLEQDDSIVRWQETMENDLLYDLPPGPETPLPPISKLSATKPSPLLALHLVEMIYSYCFTLRLYNGDWQSDPVESAMLSLSISSVLCQRAEPGTVSEVLSHCLEQTCSPALRHMGGFQFGLGLLGDIVSLLSLGGAALVCLLCDMHRMIQAAERVLKSEKSSKSRKEVTRNLKSAERKVYFMMCWVHEQPAEAWLSLANVVEAEKGAATTCTSSSTKDSLRVEERVEPRGSGLIEEVQ